MDCLSVAKRIVLFSLTDAEPASEATRRRATHQRPPMVLSYLQAETAAGRQPYSIFDLLAGLGTGFLANMCMTVVVPVALSSAESRNHPSPLTGSGGVAAATSLGMSLSVVLMYPWPST